MLTRLTDPHSMAYVSLVSGWILRHCVLSKDGSPQVSLPCPSPISEVAPETGPLDLPQSEHARGDSEGQDRQEAGWRNDNHVVARLTIELVDHVRQEVAVRDFWGSCTSGGRLQFHWCAVCLPPSLIEYLVVLADPLGRAPARCAILDAGRESRARRPQASATAGRRRAQYTGFPA